MTIKLRPYQAEANAAVYSHWQAGKRSVMLQLPTGGGKTSCFSDIARTFALSDRRVLLLSHRTELVDQGAARMQLMSGLPVGVIQGTRKRTPSAIQSASVASIANRLDAYASDAFDLVITDEAHHSTSTSYRKIYEKFFRAKKLGVTATPIRTDGSGFGDLFDVLVPGPQPKWMIDNGFLSDFRLIADPHQMTTAGVKKIGGEYSAKALAEANDSGELSGDVVDSYLKHCPGYKCLVFAVNVEHSQAIADRYNAAGIKAMHIDGETPKGERKDGIEAFTNGDLQVVCNVGLFTEGTDIPGVEAVQCCRPTASLSLWLQMLGRGLRPSARDCILIDHTNNYVTHGRPDRDRRWSLDGCEDFDPTETRIVINKDTNVVEEIKWEGDEPDYPFEKKVDLVEISEDWLDAWLEDLAAALAVEGRPVGAVVAEFQRKGAPLEVFEEIEHLKGYQRGWARLVYNVSQKNAAKLKSGKAVAARVPKEYPELTSETWLLICRLGIPKVVGEARESNEGINKRTAAFKNFVTERSDPANFAAIGKALGQNPKTLRPVTEKTALTHLKKFLPFMGLTTKKRSKRDGDRWVSYSEIVEVRPVAKPMETVEAGALNLAYAV